MLHLFYNFDEIFTETNRELKDFFKCYGVDINLVVLDWLSTCFSEIICPDQLLKLYDVLLVTNNYQLLILVALAIIDNKQKKVREKTSKQDILNVFRDIKYEDIDLFAITKTYIENNEFN